MYLLQRQKTTQTSFYIISDIIIHIATLYIITNSDILNYDYLIAALNGFIKSRLEQRCAIRIELIILTSCSNQRSNSYNIMFDYAKRVTKHAFNRRIINLRFHFNLSKIVLYPPSPYVRHLFTRLIVAELAPVVLLISLNTVPLFS